MNYAQINECGFFDMQTSFPDTNSTPGRITSCYELELFSDCDGKAIINDFEYKLLPNTILFCQPGAVRRSIAVFKCHFVHFSMKQDSKYAELLRSAPVIYSIIDAAAYRDTLTSLIRHASLDKENRTSDFADAKMTELLYMLACDAEKNLNLAHFNAGKNTTGKMIADIISYMHFNYGEKLTLSELSERYFYSPNYIRTVFKKITGTSPREYLENIRLSEAKLLLLDGKLPIGNISDACGFSSQSYFTAIFRKNFGCTPDFFRKKLQEAISDIFAKQ